MNPIEQPVDPLFDFELKVARRADELSRDKGEKGRNALELWCQAERDVFDGPHAEAGQHAGGSTARERQHCG